MVSERSKRKTKQDLSLDQILDNERAVSCSELACKVAQEYADMVVRISTVLAVYAAIEDTKLSFLTVVSDENARHKIHEHRKLLQRKYPRLDIGLRVVSNQKLTLPQIDELKAGLFPKATLIYPLNNKQ